MPNTFAISLNRKHSILIRRLSTDAARTLLIRASFYPGQNIAVCNELKRNLVNSVVFMVFKKTYQKFVSKPDKIPQFSRICWVFFIETAIRWQCLKHFTNNGRTFFMTFGSLNAAAELIGLLSQTTTLDGKKCFKTDSDLVFLVVIVIQL